MASRLILKDIKAPIHLLLCSSAPSRATAPLAQTFKNLLVPIPRQTPQSAVGEFDRPLLSRDLKSAFDCGFRMEVRGKRQPVVDDDDEQSDSNFGDFDGCCTGDDRDGDDFDVEDFDADDSDDNDDE